MNAASGRGCNYLSSDLCPLNDRLVPRHSSYSRTLVALMISLTLNKKCTFGYILIRPRQNKRERCLIELHIFNDFTCAHNTWSHTENLPIVFPLEGATFKTTSRVTTVLGRSVVLVLSSGQILFFSAAFLLVTLGCGHTVS